MPCAAAGLAMIDSGLARSRNAAHSILGALCVLSVAALVYFVVGFAWQGYAGRPAHIWFIAGKPWNWLGAEPFLLRNAAFDGSPMSLTVLFGIFSAGLAAIIPLGAASERWRLGASCASTILLAGWTFPLFAHWAWSGGWLEQLGVNYGLGRGFIDSGGAGAIQVVGGLTALSTTWIIGPRRDKYTSERMPVATPGHNATHVLFGCFMAWLGWMGLDCSGAILFTGIPAVQIGLVVVNATLASNAAVLAAAATTRARYGKPDASLCANGWVAGLVASSAGCAVVRPAGAVLAGVVAGVLVVFSVEWLEVHLQIDDPGGAIPVHALAGLWGLFVTGLLAESSSPGQWIAQLVGIATLLGFILPLTYALNWLLNRIRPQRAAPEGERQGLDLYELGAGAYPDFITHNEDI